MSTAIKDYDLSGETIRYGEVRIGGSGTYISGTAIKSTPPHFTIHARNQYDETGRTVISQRIHLDVRAVFFSESAALSKVQLKKVRRELLKPRQAIELDGTGSGFDTNEPDVAWGPTPISCTIEMHGRQAATLNWSVEYDVVPCDLTNEDFNNRLKSFVFSQSYSLDDEGLLTRLTKGYWEISPQLSSNQAQVADQFRESINVQIPPGFRRVAQDYPESPDKTRMDFRIVDTQLAGDALPPFISRGEGSFAFGTEGPGFSKGIASLTATLTVAPGVPPNYAFLQFFLMAQQKFEEMNNATGEGNGVIPIGLTIERGLWERSRTSRFSMQWMKTGCIAEFLSEAFWEPLDNSGNWDAWSQSIDYMWHQRGVGGVYSDPTNDVQVNLCTNTSEVTIAHPEANNPIDNTAEALEITCQNIDPEKSWLDYDVEVKFLRVEHKSFHRQAVDPSRTTTSIADPVNGTEGIQFEESFDSSGKEDVIEENGLPEQFVLLKAKGFRVQHPPVFPVIAEIDGQQVEPFGKPQIASGIAFNVGCPVYKMRGYRLYKVKGVVTKIDEVNKNPVVCNPDEENETPIEE